MIDLKEFYRGFQVNYFEYRAAYLQHALENIHMYDISDILNSSSKEMELAHKNDIRQNYFLALETLFTLIFCLCPGDKGIINDRAILKRIVKFKIPAQLEAIAASEEGLNFLDQEIRFGIEIQSLIEYIFYFNVTDQEFKKGIPASLDAIKYGLRQLAKDFSDRREYNSYKHGFRSFPYFSTFSVSSLGSWDIKDSLTFYSEEKEKASQKRKINLTTKVFDTKRDLKMTAVCSSFIWNIVRLRNASSTSKKKLGSCYLIKRLSQKRNNRIQHLERSPSRLKWSNKRRVIVLLEGLTLMNTTLAVKNFRT